MPANPYQRKPTNILNVVNASCYVHHWRIRTGIKAHHCKECEKASVKENNLFSIKFIPCRKPMNVINVCVCEDSVIFQSSFNIKEFIPKRSH